MAHISVNSILNAFSQGVSQLYRKFESPSEEKIILVFNLLMESDNCDNELLNEIVLKLIGNNDFRISKLLKKLIKKVINGKKIPIN